MKTKPIGIVELSNSTISDFNYRKAFPKKLIFWEKFNSRGCFPQNYTSRTSLSTASRSRISITVSKNISLVIISFDDYSSKSMQECMEDNYLSTLKYAELLREEISFMLVKPKIVILQSKDGFYMKDNKDIRYSIKAGIKEFVKRTNRTSKVKLILVETIKDLKSLIETL
jgi:hypothetical protein